MKITAILATILLLAACKQKNNESTNINHTDWTLLGFVKADSINPIMQPSAEEVFYCPVGKKETKWEALNVLNPCAIVKDEKVYLLYRAQDTTRTSRIGIAVSTDGLHFTKQVTPIFYPDNDSMKKYEWPGGVEDPRIAESEDGNYILTYTAYDGKIARLCFATSKDLLTWQKQGLVLKADKYKNLWSKSGAIVTAQRGDKLVAVKINGKYCMYFGDTDLFMATSNDLIHWDVAESQESQKMIPVLYPRAGYFDSRLVEPGPLALQRPQGILLIYNSSNAASFNDSAIPKFTYSASQALFDGANPCKLISRMDSSFIHPEKLYEKNGEVNEVTFVEGLVHFKKKWLLYYGTADSRIAVAVRHDD